MDKKQKRFTTKEKTALIVLVILMICVVGVGAFFIIDNSNRANQTILNPTNTTVSGALDSIPVETKTTNKDNTEATKRPEKSTESKSTQPTANGEKPEKTTKPTSPRTPSKTSSKTSSNTSSNNNSSPVPVVKPTQNPSHNSKDVLTVNGTKCYVGDNITIAVNLKTPVVLENFQGTTSYDNSYLKFVNAQANTNGLVNDHESVIYYNGSNISTGFDFTKNGTIYTATFKVLKKGSTKVTNDIEILTELNGDPVNLDKCSHSVEVYS